jgi:hypothetical protein
MIDTKLHLKAILSQTLGAKTHSCGMKCKCYCLEIYGALSYSHWSICIFINNKHALYIHTYIHTHTHTHMHLRNLSGKT